MNSFRLYLTAAVMMFLLNGAKASVHESNTTQCTTKTVTVRTEVWTYNSYTGWMQVSSTYADNTINYGGQMDMEDVMASDYRVYFTAVYVSQSTIPGCGECWEAFDEPQAWTYGSWSPDCSTAAPCQSVQQSRTNQRWHYTGERSNLGNVRNTGSYLEQTTEYQQVSGCAALTWTVFEEEIEGWHEVRTPWPSCDSFWEDETYTEFYDIERVTRKGERSQCGDERNVTQNTYLSTGSRPNQSGCRPLNPRPFTETGAWQEVAEWPSTDDYPSGVPFTQHYREERTVRTGTRNDRGDETGVQEGVESYEGTRSATGTGAEPNSQPQTISVSLAQSATYGVAVTFTGHARDSDGDLSSISFYVTGPGIPPWTYVGSVPASGSDATVPYSGWIPPQAGDFAVHIRAWDQHGEVDYNGDVMCNFKVAKAPMTAPTSASASVAVGTGWAPVISAPDSNGTGTKMFVVPNYTNWGTAQWTATNATSYPFYVGQKADGNHEGNINDPIQGAMYYNVQSYTLTVTGTPTSFTFTPVGAPFTYNGEEKYISVTANPSGATYVVIGTSGVAAGDYKATATAYGSYSGYGELVWHIAKANQPVVQITPAPATIEVNESLLLTASGGAGTGGYVWGGEASGTGDTVRVSYATTGEHTVTVYREGDNNYNVSSTSTAKITVNPAGPPQITGQPAARTVTVGETASFSVTASGGSISYQWRKNGASIAGATGSGLTLADVSRDDEANYDVLVFNNYRTVTSEPARLTVNEPPVVLAASAQVVSPTEIHVTVSVNDFDSNLERFEILLLDNALYLGWVPMASVSVSGPAETKTYTWTRPTAFGPGIYYLWVRAYDSLGALDSNGGQLATVTVDETTTISVVLSPLYITPGDRLTVEYQNAPANSWIGLYEWYGGVNSGMTPISTGAGADGIQYFSATSTLVVNRPYCAKMYVGASTYVTESNPVYTATSWGLTVVDGRGGGASFPVGTVVPIEANPDPAGEAFTGWTKIIDGPGTIGNASQRLTTFTMGSGYAAIRANYTGRPQISSPTTASGTVGQLFNYILTASNSPTDFTVGSLPPGLTFQILQNPTRGVISGVPTTAGTVNVPISASNAAGAGYGQLTLEIATAQLPELNVHIPVSQ